MTRRNVGLSALMVGCALILSGGMASAEDLPPLPSPPPEYADKKMPAGWWTDPKVIEEGGKIYRGEFKTEVNCSSCHGADGTPKKKGHGISVTRISSAVSQTRSGSGVSRKGSQRPR